jgi:hypothetical protein
VEAQTSRTPHAFLTGQLTADETDSSVEIERDVDAGERGEENGDEID